MIYLVNQIKKVETNIGDFDKNQQAAPLPDANKSQPLNDLSPNQTQSQRLLNFITINKIRLFLALFLFFGMIYRFFVRNV